MSLRILHSYFLLNIVYYITILKCLTVNLNATPNIKKPDCNTIFSDSYLNLLNTINLKFKEWLFNDSDDIIVPIIDQNDMQYLKISCHKNKNCIDKKIISLKNLENTLESLECFHAFLSLYMFHTIRNNMKSILKKPNLNINNNNKINSDIKFTLLKKFMINMISIFVGGYYIVKPWQLDFSIITIKMEPLEAKNLIATKEACNHIDNDALYLSLYKICQECQAKNNLPRSLKFSETNSTEIKSNQLYLSYHPNITNIPKRIFSFIQYNRYIYKQYNSTSQHLINNYVKKNERVPTNIDILHPEFQRKKENLLNRLKLSESEIKSFERNTADHLKNDKWKNNKGLRLSSSYFGRICFLQPTTCRDNIVKAALRSFIKIQNDNNTNDYQNKNEYCQELENLAIKEFEKATEKKVLPCGIFIDENLNYLVATPDGMVGENEIIEIKCPYNIQNMTIREGIQKIKYLLLNKNSDKICLKRNSHVYYQIQGQLHITKKMNCYLVVWTNYDIYIEIIPKNDDFWNKKMEKKLTNFYMDFMVPKIIEIENGYDCSN
ncbi:uncharacterized protein LOC126894803 [Daktulosphaira vitifoliae]|uniref:uncharacterized protein LOC126894803 n=1 Tax=Daktulosphaira vitifoliae TaxID=58002 RepID=UPI0021AA24F2|nr:uncharacterized protein LOC126894803 [Daktulosphaira vitifoliae]